MQNNLKLIAYNIFLLIFIGLLVLFLFHAKDEAMSMVTMISVSSLIGLYSVLMSLVGEGKIIDERELAHRYTANRIALIGGTLVLCAGVLYQLFNHNLDYWLLAGLISINLLKIISFIYSHYRH